MFSMYIRIDRFDMLTIDFTRRYNVASVLPMIVKVNDGVSMRITVALDKIKEHCLGEGASGKLASFQ